MTIAQRLSLLRTTAAIGALVLGSLAVAAPPASGALETGWLRLAHLSPNTPPVDVYLYNFGDPAARVVLKHVSYGTVSPYLPVTTGEYTVAMRSAGAPATKAPVLSTAVAVRAGHAYTVAGMGPLAGLRLDVFSDMLTAPPGYSLIRVIQASLRQPVVAVRAGRQVLARSLPFAAVTSYQAISPGTLTLAVNGASESALERVTLPAGSIRTIAVLDNRSHLRIVSLADAAGSGRIPAGVPGVGLGGTAPRPGPSRLPWLAITGIGVLIALGGLARLRRARTPQPRTP